MRSEDRQSLSKRDVYLNAMDEKWCCVLENVSGLMLLSSLILLLFDIDAEPLLWVGLAVALVGVARWLIVARGIAVGGRKLIDRQASNLSGYIAAGWFLIFGVLCVVLMCGAPFYMIAIAWLMILLSLAAMFVLWQKGRR